MPFQKKPAVDIVLDVLNACRERYPNSDFVHSLHQQYLERGFLTKKQLEGLHSKAQKATRLEASKLATLEAIIKKMPTRYKSELPREIAPVYETNIPIKLVIAAILQKHPGHKPVLALQAKNEQHTPLTKQEIHDLQRFYKMLVLGTA
jgi:hypothetical protein